MIKEERESMILERTKFVVEGGKVCALHIGKLLLELGDEDGR